MSWQTFKIKTEKKFKRKPLYSNVYGWQIQPGTKWNPGLTPGEINDLESLFGFDFPTDYKEMLLVINGFDRDQISIDPEGTREDQFGGNMYTYPRNYEKSKWLTEEILEYINYTKELLSDAGFDVDQLIGFVPLYAHRALVVFKDKSLSPVISVHQGTDVIIYGHSLMEYWKNELK